MVKVVPLFKPFKTIFYFKIFKPGTVLFGSIKVWIDLKFVWMHLNSNSVQTVSTTTMHCSGPPASPSPLFQMDTCPCGTMGRRLPALTSLRALPASYRRPKPCRAPPFPRGATETRRRPSPLRRFLSLPPFPSKRVCNTPSPPPFASCPICDQTTAQPCIGIPEIYGRICA
jgi:hypothetical protein